MAIETPPAELGAACPDFRLPAVDGRTYARDDFSEARVLVVMFICNHCPYVKAVEDRIISLAREYGPRGPYSRPSRMRRSSTACTYGQWLQMNITTNALALEKSSRP